MGWGGIWLRKLIEQAVPQRDSASCPWKHLFCGAKAKGGPKRPLWLEVGAVECPCVLTARSSLRDENPPEMHKRHKTEALEVPSDLHDMEIPLEDMGDVIVLTRL